MTREQAKREIDSLDFYLQNHTDDYGEESHTAMMMAIKALEQQTCEDAVSREAVLMELDKYLCGVPFDEKGIDEVIKELPPVNPQRTGHWIEDEYEMKVWCSACGEENDKCSKYCPNCGNYNGGNENVT